MVGVAIIGLPFFFYTNKFPFSAPYSHAVKMEMSIEYCSLGVALATIAAFMVVELQDLEADLQTNGWTEKFSQGNQEPYDRARPQGQSYASLNGNYQKIIKQLDGMLPPPALKDIGDDGFDDFVTGRDEA